MILDNNFLTFNKKNKETKALATVDEKREVGYVRNQRAFGSMTMPKANLQNTPEADTFQASKSNNFDAKKLIACVPLLYMTGFAIGLCPGLALLAGGMFMFSKKGQEFRNQISNLFAPDGYLQQMQQFFNQPQQQVVNNAEAKNNNTNSENPQAKPVQNEKAVQNTQTVNASEKTAPAAQKEAKQMTPFEKAQARYNKAQDYQTKAELNLIKQEEAHNIAKEKLAVAEARLAKAQEEYNNAKSEVKVQMTERMARLNQSVDVKRSNLAIAKEKEDFARAKLEDAQMKVANAQHSLETLQAEEIVDTSL